MWGVGGGRTVRGDQTGRRKPDGGRGKFVREGGSTHFAEMEGSPRLGSQGPGGCRGDHKLAPTFGLSIGCTRRTVMPSASQLGE